MVCLIYLEITNAEGGYKMYLITAVIVPVVICILVCILCKLSYKYPKIGSAIYYSNKAVFIFSIIAIVSHFYLLFAGMHWGWLLVAYLLYNLSAIITVPMENNVGTDNIWDFGSGDIMDWLSVGAYILVAPLFWHDSTLKYLSNRTIVKRKQAKGAN